MLALLMLVAPGGQAVSVRTAEPQPAVLIHGFASSPAVWDAYTRPERYLARIGRRGFAVGADRRRAGCVWAIRSTPARRQAQSLRTQRRSATTSPTSDARLDVGADVVPALEPRHEQGQCVQCQ